MKKMIEEQQKQIDEQQKKIVELHGYIEGLKYIQAGNNAIVAAMLVTVGATKEKPLELKRELVSETLANEKRIVSCYDAEACVHRLYVE